MSGVELEVLPDGDAVASAGADVLAALLRESVDRTGRCTIAVSGGKTPRTAFAKLAHEDLDWDRITFFQVDERLAPDGDDDRNLTHLLQAMGDTPARIDPMPVTDADPVAGAAAYAARLPERFDVVHLGIGADGHCASLLPGDPVLEVEDRLVALTGTYQGRRRMTLTYPALRQADRIVWLVSGADKRDALRGLLAHDPSIPAGRVGADHAVVLCDVDAA